MTSPQPITGVTQDPEHEMGAITKGLWCNSHYEFVWTDLHLPSAHTAPLRHRFDELGSATLDRLQHIIKTKKKKLKEAGEDIPKIDLYATLLEYHNIDPVLGAFWAEVTSVPDWVDWQQLERAQPFLYRYGAANVISFALQGFFGENSAAKGVTEVLARTGGFKTSVLLKRLFETTQWLLQVTDSVASVQPGGDAWISTIRVRLLHCHVREMVLERLKQRGPEYFDLEQFGLPCNVLDSIHSITTFACLPLFSQLPQMGITPGKQETTDYIALFRYQSYLLGTPNEYVASPEQARATMESMLVHEVHEPTETSRCLGSNLMAAVEDLPPFNVSRQFLEAGARFFNGDDFCDSLDLGHPAWYSYAAWHTFRWILVALAMAQRVCPPLDKFMVKTFHDLMHDVIIHSKHGLNGGTDFAIKYVPEGQTQVKRERSGRVFTPGWIKRPLETALVSIFLLFWAGFVPLLLYWATPIWLRFCGVRD